MTCKHASFLLVSLLSLSCGPVLARGTDDHSDSTGTTTSATAQSGRDHPEDDGQVGMCPTTTTTTTTTTTSTGTVAAAGTDDCIEQEVETEVEHVGRAIDDVVGRPGATVVKDPTTGVITVTLPDGRVFNVTPQGKTRRHRGEVQTEVETESDGTLRLKSKTSKVEIELRGTHHNAPELRTKLENDHWRDITAADDHVEITTPEGDRLSVAPNMQVTTSTATGGTQVTKSDDGITVTHKDGVIQIYFGYPHDLTQLQDAVTKLGIPGVTVGTDGTLTIDLNGQTFRFKLKARLEDSTSTEDGIRVDKSRIMIRYKDGKEQEIVEVK